MSRARNLLAGALLAALATVAAPARAADAGPSLGTPVEPYVPVLPGPWEGQFRSGMHTAGRGAVTAGAGLAAFGAGVHLVQLGEVDQDQGLTVAGVLLSVGGVIGLLTGAPMMSFGADRSHRALVRAGVRVTGLPGDLSSAAWLGMLVVNLVNVMGNQSSREILYAQGVLFVTAYGLAATQMQINTSAYWARTKVAPGTARLDLQVHPFVTREGRGEGAQVVQGVMISGTF